jgi:hypothetical protein
MMKSTNVPRHRVPFETTRSKVILAAIVTVGIILGAFTYFNPPDWLTAIR